MTNPWPREYLGSAASKFLALLIRTLRPSRPLSQDPIITLRCLQETSASVSQGPAQHQGVETELRCGQCCLDAHGLDRAVEAWVRPPSSQLSLPPPHELFLGWWSPGETLLCSYLGGTFCQSLLPPRYLLPSSAAADSASLENSPKSRVTQQPSSPSHLPDELLPKLLLLNPMGQTQPLAHQSVSPSLSEAAFIPAKPLLPRSCGSA